MNMISIPNLPVPVAHYEVGKQLDRGTQQSVRTFSDLGLLLR
jgi:hypothetical protein